MLHYRHAIAQVCNHAQIVCHQQVGQAITLAQVREQVQDFRLHRYVERRGRFIQQQHTRLQDQRAGDGDALALAAGELVRVAEAVAVVQADLEQDGVNPLLMVVQAVDGHRLGQRGFHGMTRMQRTVRVLEHHLYMAATRTVELVLQRLAVNAELAAPVRVLSGQTAQHRGLARAGFADQAERFSILDGKAHVAQHMVGLCAVAKGQVERIDFDHVFHG